MTKNDQYSSRFSSSLWGRAVAATVFFSTVCLSGYWIAEKVSAFSAPATNHDVTVWIEINGSDKNGFNVLAKNPGDVDMTCSVDVKIHMKTGWPKSYEYPNRPVNKKTDRVSVGGESGLPDEITETKVEYINCK